MRLLVPLVLLACAQEPCPQGYELRNGFCFVAEDETTSTTSDTASSSSDGFGVVCVDDKACKTAADYCVISPGAPEGYCSATGCDQEPSICPEDWACLDLAQFQAGLPWICQQP